MNTKSLPDEVAAFLRDLANDLPALADELRAPSITATSIAASAAISRLRSRSPKSRRNSMTNELTKYGDSFDAWNDEMVGTEQRQSGLLRGLELKFTNEAAWVDQNEETPSPDTHLIVTGITRAVQKWKDQKPEQTIILGDGEKFPNLDGEGGWNSQVPRSEWVEGPDGKPRGPWQAQQFLYLMNPETMEEYTWPTFTTGGNIAIRELIDKIKWMRRLRGAGICPVVSLSDTFMNTRFGGRQRPHFIIHRWVDLSGSGEGQAALPSPTTPPTLPSANQQLEQFGAEEPATPPAVVEVKPAAKGAKHTAAKPAKAGAKGAGKLRSKSFAVGDRTVSEPSLKEELNDDLPF